MANVPAGFQKTGAYPVNLMIFPDSEFAASEMFIPHLISEVNIQEINEVNVPQFNISDNVGEAQRSSNSDDSQKHVNQCLQKPEEALPGSSKQHVSRSNIVSYPKLLVKERKLGKKKGYSRMLTESPERELALEKREKKLWLLLRRRLHIREGRKEQKVPF